MDQEIKVLGSIFQKDNLELELKDKSMIFNLFKFHMKTNLVNSTRIIKLETEANMYWV